MTTRLSVCLLAHLRAEWRLSRSCHLKLEDTLHNIAGINHISDDRVIALNPIDSHSGSPAYATGLAVGGLQQGRRVDGALVATTASQAHIFKPAHSKGASKTFDNGLCDSAAVAQYETRGYALVGLFGDGTVRVFSLPGLKEIGGQRLNHVLDIKRLSDAIVTPTGDILGWTGPSEIALLNTFGDGIPAAPSGDKLFDANKLVPPRPTISNLQWIAGTQYITPQDLDILIGGPGRPPSKRMVAEARAQQESEFQRQRDAARTGRAPPPDPSQEGWGAYMQRQIQERTEQLGFAETSMENTANDSAKFSDSVSDYIAKQKRQAALGFLRIQARVLDQGMIARRVSQPASQLLQKRSGTRRCLSHRQPRSGPSAEQRKESGGVFQRCCHCPPLWTKDCSALNRRIVHHDL